MGIRDPYSELGVGRDVSKAELPEAFARKCSELEPDDPADTLQLKRLEEAFEILDDEARRAAYDADNKPAAGGGAPQQATGAGGKEGGSVQDKFAAVKQQAEQLRDQAEDPNKPTLDAIPEEVLGKIADLLSDTLGNGQLFEQYVGQLAVGAGSLANKLASGEDEGLRAERQAKIQEEREAVLAGFLRARLQPFVDGSKKNFRDDVRKEAHDLALLPFGTGMLHAIGYAYIHAAKPHLGSAVSEWFVHKGHKFLTDAGALKAKAQVGGMMVMVRHFGHEHKGRMSVAEAAHYLEGRVGWVISSLWHLLMKDLEDTLRHVTRAVLSEDGLDEDTVVKRAQALFDLGDIFTETKRDEDRFRLAGAGGLDALQGAGKGTTDGLGGSQGLQGGPDLETLLRDGVGNVQQQVDSTVPKPDQAEGAIRDAGKSHVQPAASQVASKAKPFADDIADKQVRPGAQAVADKAPQAAEEASSSYIKPAADTVAKEAEPRAKELTEQGLKPAAAQVSKQAKPAAEQVKGQVVKPGAQAVKENAVPLADKATDEVVKPLAKDVEKNAHPLADDISKDVIQPAAKAVAENAVPLTEKVTEDSLKPLLKDNAQQLQPLAQKLSEEHLRPGAKGVAENLEPAAENLTENEIKPRVALALEQLQQQAGVIANEGPELAQKLPPALRRAADTGKIPKVLRDDVALLADYLERFVVPKVVDAAERAPELAEKAAEKVEPAVDRASEVIRQEAHDVATKVEPAADKAARNIQGTGKELSVQADRTADKLSEAAVQAAERAAERAVPAGDTASEALQEGAKHAHDNAGELGDKASSTIKQAAKKATEQADDTAEQATRRVDQAADSVQRNAEPAAEEASARIQQGAKSVAKAAPEAGEKASKTVKDAAGSVQREAPKAGDQAAQAIKEGGQQVSANAEPAAEGATDQAAKQGKGVAAAVHKLNQGEISTSEATDKLAQQIAGAPDRVADFVDKLGGKAGAQSQGGATKGGKGKEAVEQGRNALAKASEKGKDAVANASEKGKDLAAKASDGAQSQGGASKGKEGVGQGQDAIAKASEKGKDVAAKATDKGQEAVAKATEKGSSGSPSQEAGKGKGAKADSGAAKATSDDKKQRAA